MYDITKYKRTLRREYQIDLIVNEDSVKNYENQLDKSRKEIRQLEDELYNEKDYDKYLKLEISFVIAKIDEQIALLKKLITEELLDYQQTGSGLNNFKRNARNLRSLINMKNALNDIEYTRYLDNPYSKEYVLTTDVLYNIGLLNIKGNNPYEDENLNGLFTKLEKEFDKIKNQLAFDTQERCKKTLDEIKISNHTIKSNGFDELSRLTEDLLNRIKQSLKIKHLQVKSGSEPLNFFHLKLIDTSFNDGDTRIEKLIHDCNNIGLYDFENLNVIDAKELLNKKQYFNALRVALVEYQNMLPKSFDYGYKLYSTSSLIYIIDEIINYIDKLTKEIDEKIDATNLDKYEQLVESVTELEYAEQKYNQAREKFYDAKGKDAIVESSYEQDLADKKLTEEFHVFYDIANKLGIVDKIKEYKNIEKEEETRNLEIEEKSNLEIEENNQKRELYQMKAEERMIARNDYFQSGAFLEIPFAEFLRRKGKIELADLEEYITRLLESIYSKYENTDKSVTFKQFLFYNEDLKTMLEGFVTPYDLEEFIKSKEKEKVENKRIDI